MKSWTERARARGAGAPLVRPPPCWLGRDAPHVLVDARSAECVMFWRPGVEFWLDANGERTNAEDAFQKGLRYLRPYQPTS